MPKPYTKSGGDLTEQRVSQTEQTNTEQDQEIEYVKELISVSFSKIPDPYFTVTLDGSAYVDSGILKFRAARSGTFSSARVDVENAPTGSALIVDINNNGSTILSSPLSISASGTSDSTTSFASASFTAGDIISIDIDQVGSTTPGGDSLFVTLYYS